VGANEVTHFAIRRQPVEYTQYFLVDWMPRERRPNKMFWSVWNDQAVRENYQLRRNLFFGSRWYFRWYEFGDAEKYS
jgi:hypothetical protein